METDKEFFERFEKTWVEITKESFPNAFPSEYIKPPFDLHFREEENAELEVGD